MNLARAICIASTEFADKYDKGGRPYILHCLAVMYGVSFYKDDDLMIIAVLHDLVEDTHWTFEMLRTEGFSERVISALILLTHLDGVEYDDYIRALAINEDATRVKRADLEHNSLIMRMKGLRKKDFDRLEKYHRSYEYLKD